MPPWADLVGHRQVRRRQGDERGEYFVHVKGGWSGGSRVESRKDWGREQGDNGGRAELRREGRALMAMKHDIINGCRPKCPVS